MQRKNAKFIVNEKRSTKSQRHKSNVEHFRDLPPPLPLPPSPTQQAHTSAYTVGLPQRTIAGCATSLVVQVSGSA